ncbi:hypothetical protein L9F63_011709, partial [Diploptera punctata]
SRAAWRVDFCGIASNASTILFVVSASVLMRGLPGAYVIVHAAIVICCCIFNAILTND